MLGEEKSNTADAATSTTSQLDPYGFEDLLSLKVTTGAISPAMARHMRETMHFERQRPINSRNVDRLAEEMRRGWFLAGSPIFICKLPDGRKQIVNGNHTLEGIAASGITVPLTIIEKSVGTMEHVARCYATFDLQRMRSWKDTLQAVGMSDELPMVEAVASAVGVIDAGFSYDPGKPFIVTSRALRLKNLPQYKTAAYLLAAAFEGKPAKNVRAVKRAPFFAVALMTARYQPSIASEFWGGLVADDGLGKADPRKTLLRYAQNNPSVGSNGRRLHATAAALAWNAYFNGREIEYVKPNQAKDLMILGTPWHKGNPA